MSGVEPSLAVVGIGNALVDVLSYGDDALVARLGLAKGSATMVDLAHSDEVYAALGPGVEGSGGSAANTIAGLASFGTGAAFIGKIGDDPFGEIFTHDMAAIGVHFARASLGAGPTGRCLVLVTPDAERTMCTHLGVSSELGPADVPGDLVARARVTYLEGYLWDQPEAKDAFRYAAEVAHEAGAKVALSLSDPFCVERHRADFRELIDGHVDVLFANADEITSLYEVTDFEVALARVESDCEIAALTRGAQGAAIVTRGQVHEVPAEPVEHVVDTTGAGDLYAAGFLHGLTTERDPATCGRLGGLAAAEVISHLGARPHVSLAKLTADTLR